MTAANIYTIPLHKPFIDVLAQNILTEHGKQPDTLTRLLVLLPTRRACRALREALLRAGNGVPMLLPRIRPLGEINEEELLLTGMGEGIAGKIINLPPAIPEYRRLAMLALQIRQINALSEEPMPMAQALSLAQELAQLIDEVAREKCDFAKLFSLVPEKYAAHWQLTLDFLSLVTHQWPKILQEEGVLDPVERRNRLTMLLVEEWRRHPPSYPVIAAGSTGSIPATAELLKVIDRLPWGRVILPGLDIAASNDVWEQINELHPQYGLKKLLMHIGCERGEVKVIDARDIKGAPVARTQFIHIMLQPAATTDRWKELKLPLTEALANVQLHECATPLEEAKVISLLLRQCLEERGCTAALVTNDRSLAEQVGLQMMRYGVTVDDSAGRDLSRLPEGVFLRLAAEAAMSRLAPIPLLSLLKHPLAGCGMGPAECRKAARMLERRVLRGLRPPAGIEGLKACFTSKAESDKAIMALLDTLEKAFAPFDTMLRSDEVLFDRMLRAHIKATECIASSAEESGEKRLWNSDGGQAVRTALEEMLESGASLGCVDTGSYRDLFLNFLSAHQYRAAYGTHPRLHILSPIEARLQHYDLVIMGGMNEGSWPPAAEANPWMSRPMREKFGLPTDARAIGLSAHDFMMLSCAPKVAITRALKADNAPTIPARWLLRMQALIESTGKDVVLSDEPLRQWATLLDTPEEYSSIERLAPKPPISTRPRSLSVTQIETLMRNPYGIYARYILGLRKLEPLDSPPNIKEFGSVMHAALEHFVKRWPKELPADIEKALMSCAELALADFSTRPDVIEYWRHRFGFIARWVAGIERERRPTSELVHAECGGKWKFAAPAGEFTLTARMDRLEVKKDGSIAIIDYKTGGAPRTQDINEGFAPQLTLSAAIAERGRVDILTAPHPVSDLEYWKLGSRDGGEVTSLQKKRKPFDLREAVEEAAQGVQLLIAAFDNPEHPYYASPIPEREPRYDDYGHLSRIAEWGK